MDLFVFLSAMGVLYHKFDKIPFHSGFKIAKEYLLFNSMQCFNGNFFVDTWS